MEEESKVLPVELLIHYTKSPAFRTIHMGGVFGGVVPSADCSIQLSVFSERVSIPDLEVYTIPEGGGPATGPSRVINSRPGLVREVEANLILSPKVAKSLYEWLGAMIEAAEIVENKGVLITLDGTILSPKKQVE
jgi:hypothetical protein